jgi:hypothetical protein
MSPRPSSWASRLLTLPAFEGASAGHEECPNRLTVGTLFDRPE